MKKFLKKIGLNKYNGYCLSLVLFIYSILNILEFDLPRKTYIKGAKEVTGRIDVGIELLILTFILFIISKYYLLEKDEPLLYKCKDCGEVVFEYNIEKKYSCNVCNGELIEVNKYYKNYVEPNIPRNT